LFWAGEGACRPRRWAGVGQHGSSATGAAQAGREVADRRYEMQALDSRARPRNSPRATSSRAWRLQAGTG